MKPKKQYQSKHVVNLQPSSQEFQTPPQNQATQNLNQPSQPLPPPPPSTPSPALSPQYAQTSQVVPPPQYAQPPQPAQQKKGSKTTQIMLGCCIFLLFVLIGITGLGVFYIKQGVDILREKGVDDFVQFFDEKLGNTIRDAIEQGTKQQFENTVSPENNKIDGLDPSKEIEIKEESHSNGP